MEISSCRQRLELALREPDPDEAVWMLAVALKDEGMAQLEMYRLYDEFRAIHQDDADKTNLDAILDTMDVICGWCRADARLFNTDLQT